MGRPILPNRGHRSLLPPSLDDCVTPNHPVRFIWDFVRALEIGSLGFVSSVGQEGRPHFATELPLSAWLFGWMEQIRGNRGLEKA